MSYNQPPSIPRNHILFLDTETTGVDVNIDHLVQVAWVLTDLEGNAMGSANHIVRPEGYEISAESTAIHRIDTAQAAVYGYPLRMVMVDLRHAWLSSSCIVGYSMNMDLKFLKMAWKAQLGGRIPFWPTIDVFDYEKQVRGLYHMEEEKTLSLAKMYQLLFDEPLTRAHNAMRDAQATCRCFWELVQRGIVSLDDKKT